MSRLEPPPRRAAENPWRRVAARRNGLARRRPRAEKSARPFWPTPRWPTPSRIRCRRLQRRPCGLPRLARPGFSPALRKARAEVFFNQMQPFYNAMVIYVLAGLLGVFSWFNLSETLAASAVWLICAGFCHPHDRSDLSHGAGRPSAGDQSLIPRPFSSAGARGSSDSSWKNFTRTASARSCRRASASSRSSSPIISRWTATRWK